MLIIKWYEMPIYGHCTLHDHSSVFSEVHEKLSQTMDEIKQNFDNAKKRINAMEKMSKVSAEFWGL